MGYYKTLLEKWKNISEAMAKIEEDNQSRYFTDFNTEVKNRIDEYQSLSEKEKTRFDDVQFPFESELNDFDDDSY